MIWILLLLIVVLLFSCLRIVPQAQEYVIEFLGKYRTTWGAGLHFKIPILERISRKITLKEQVLDSAPQPVITKDNVTMRIDTVVYYRIFDAKLYGGTQSAAARLSLCRHIGVPSGISVNALIDALNALMTKDEFFKLTGDLNYE